VVSMMKEAPSILPMHEAKRKLDWKKSLYINVSKD
jgi:hypothetical protein